MARGELRAILRTMSSPIPFAHETWFDAQRYAADWGFAAERLTLGLLLLAVLATVAVRIAARFFPGVDVGWLSRMAPFMPFAVRAHVAVSLIGLLSLGFYLSPAMDLEANVAGLSSVFIIWPRSFIRQSPRRLTIFWGVPRQHELDRIG